MPSDESRATKRDQLLAAVEKVGVKEAVRRIVAPETTIFRFRRGSHEWAVAGMGTAEEAELYADGYAPNKPYGWSRQASVGELAIFIRKVQQ